MGGKINRYMYYHVTIACLPAHSLPTHIHAHTHMHTDMTLRDLALVVPMNNKPPRSLVSLLPVHCCWCVRKKNIISAAKAAFFGWLVGTQYLLGYSQYTPSPACRPRAVALAMVQLSFQDLLKELKCSKGRIRVKRHHQLVNKGT